MQRYCVIMCGGAGTRFWPFSRETRPKQFIDFFGTGRSLLQLTADRLQPIVKEQNILFLTNEKYAEAIREQLPWVPAANILLEPSRRDTAPGLLWAARHIASRDRNASFVALSADNIILKDSKFHEALRRGFEFVENSDRLLALGMEPATPNTTYCYLQKGEGFRKDTTVWRIKTVAEKPDSEMAEIFRYSGEFLWNTGIYLWRAATLIKAFDRYAPDLASIFDVEDKIFGSSSEARFINENFPKAESIAIEYAILDKADNAYVMGADIGWSDLCTWKALYDLSPKSQEGNVAQNCRSLLYNSHGCIVTEESDKVVVVAGLKDYIVADSKNALLICPIESEQKIRNIVNDVRDCFGDDFT